MFFLTLGCASTPKRAEPVVKKLDVQGNKALSDRQIEAKILTTKTGWWPFAQKQYFDPVVWSTDLKRIKRLYGSRGYYQAEIQHDSAKPIKPDGIALEVTVHEGNPTRVGAIAFQGLETLDPAERETLIASLPLRVGNVFQEQTWENAKALLRATLRNRGYANVLLDGAALVDVSTQTATLKLVVVLGDIYYFGDIQVDRRGGTSIEPGWIWEQARLAMADGETYSDDALTEAQRRVTKMGVFAAVKVTAGTPDPETRRIAVRVETTEAPLHTLKLGGGVRIDQIRNEGRLIGEWTNRNFLGGMRRLTVHAEAGWAFIPDTYAVLSNNGGDTGLRNGPIARLRLEFEQPRLFGRPSLRERSSIGLTRTLEQTYDDLGGELVNGVVWQPRASLTVYPSHHIQGDQLNDAQTNQSMDPLGSKVLTAPLTLGCKTSGDSCFVWLSYLEEVITWDRRDNVLEPRRGWYARLSLQQGGGPLQGNFSYFRVLPEVRGYFSVGEDDELTFAARLEVGDLLPTSGNPDDSAVVTRFYGGGSQSMRGFNDRRMSPLLQAQLPGKPTDPPVFVTLPIGGNGLINGSAEVRYALTSNLTLAAFFDTGRVTRDLLQPGDFLHVMMAVGLGLRYRTPVGPIRLDIARRLQVGTKPELFVVKDGQITPDKEYEINDSCFGLGGSKHTTVVSDSLCVLHISIGEAF